MDDSRLYRRGDPVDNLSITYSSKPLSTIRGLCANSTIYAMDNPNLYLYRNMVVYRHHRDTGGWIEVGIGDRSLNEVGELFNKMTMKPHPWEIILMGYYNRRIRALARYGAIDRMWTPADVIRSFYIDASSPFPYCETRKTYRYAILYTPWSVEVIKVQKDL